MCSWCTCRALSQLQLPVPVVVGICQALAQILSGLSVVCLWGGWQCVMWILWEVCVSGCVMSVRGLWILSVLIFVKTHCSCTYFYFVLPEYSFAFFLFSLFKIVNICSGFFFHMYSPFYWFLISTLPCFMMVWNLGGGTGTWGPQVASYRDFSGTVSHYYFFACFTCKL